ncbi:MAG: hypothetical protein WCW16_01000 [Candidatus Magasanikbacteria bacterium]
MPELFRKPYCPIGSGAERVVYNHPEDERKVIGIFHDYASETPEQVKARFYFTKILHIIYPHNIPDIHHAGTDPHVIISDKLDLDEDYVRYFEDLSDFRYVHGFVAPPEELKERAERIKEENELNVEIQKLKTALGLIVKDFDDDPINFSIGSDGKSKYVDTFPVLLDTTDGVVENINFDELELSINKVSLSEQDRKKIDSLLERLKRIIEVAKDKRTRRA